MIKIKYTIKNPDGIHARPAGYLSAVAKEFSDDCHILLRKNVEDSDHCCDALSVLSIMGENFKYGDSIFLQVVFNNKEETNRDVIFEKLNNILEEHF